MRTDLISFNAYQAGHDDRPTYDLMGEGTLSPGLPDEPLEIPASRLPFLWNSLLAQANISYHPAELVWISSQAFGNDDALDVFTENPPIIHMEPPVPCAWAVFSQPIVLGQVGDRSTMDMKDATMMLRSLEWSHRHDGTVSITAYTVVVSLDTEIIDGMLIPAATQPEKGMLQFVDAAAIGGGMLVTGDPVWPPLFGTGVVCSRKTQRALAMVVQALWRRWQNPESDGYTSEVFLAEETPDVSRSTGKRETGRNVRVVVVGRKSEPLPGEPVPSGARDEPDHRWRVRGHWRMQPCGPGRRYRRRIWVEEHEAGPPDKPLKETTTVLALR
jgi:hypothetical protein